MHACVSVTPEMLSGCALTNSIFSITKVRWDNNCPSFPNTHVLKTHVHPQHHLTRSQNYVVGLAKAVSGKEVKNEKKINIK